jgi:hypothetical protein
MNRKGVHITTEKLIYILLAIFIAVIVLVIVARMAPHMFDTLKEIF